MGGMILKWGVETLLRTMMLLFTSFSKTLLATERRPTGR